MYQFRAVFSLVALVSLSLLTGCQNYIFRTFDLDRNDSLSVDAKQRLVFVTEKGGRDRDRRVVCAEPSPDALSALATSGSAAFTSPLPGASQSTDKVTGKGGFSQSEAAANIGLRSQAIQLLRDSLYRACEGYMNGVIDQTEYTFILMNIDRVMISLVAIDAIGGTPVAVGGAIGATPTAVSVEIGSDSNPKGSEGGAGADPTPPKARADVKVVPATIPHRNGVGTDTNAANVIGDIVKLNVQGTSLPAICTSLLASGRLDDQKPGQREVLESCAALLKGSVRKVMAGHY